MGGSGRNDRALSGESFKVSAGMHGCRGGSSSSSLLLTLMKILKKYK